MKLEQTFEDAQVHPVSVASALPAERAVDEVPASSVELLTEITAIITREEKRRYRLVWSVVAFCLTLAFIIARVAESRTNTADSDSLTWLLPIGASFALFLPVVAALIASFPRRKLRDSMQALARRGTVKDINALIGAQRSLIGPQTNKALRGALTDALLQVRASDRSRISESSQAELRGILANISTGVARRRHVDFYMAIIKAMEQIGDERALKAMERIANMRSHTQARVRLKQAAAECLPALRARVRETTAPETLLRAVGPDSMGELLRPVSGTAEADSELLLRPGENLSDSSPL